MVKRHAGLILISMGIWAFPEVLAQPVSRLDRPQSNWNRESNALPVLPEPAPQSSPQPESRCREEVRQPASAAERAVVRRGWKLYGPVQSYGTTKVFTALAGFDGMCRPLGYQAFVCSGDRYRNAFSRSDELAYRRVAYESSPGPPDSHYCRVCPLSRFRPTLLPAKDEHSRIPGPKRRIPVLMAVNVTTRPVGQMPEQTGGSQGREEGSLLSGKRWILSAMGERRKRRKPTSNSMVSSTGFQAIAANRFFGTVQITGASVKISQLGSTKRACLSEDANRLENEFLRTLEKATRFSVETNELRLFADKRLASLSSASSDSANCGWRGRRSLLADTLPQWVSGFVLSR